MLYLYEEYIDLDENDEVIETIHADECRHSGYSDVQHFINLGTWAGQSGASVMDGMIVYWAMIYVGY